MTFKKKIAALIVLGVAFNSSAVFAQSDYDTHWAKNDIEYFIKQQYISGDQHQKVAPNKKITRAEAIAMINRVLDLKEKKAVLYKDIKKADWYYSDICIAYANGYVSSYADGTFRPNANVSRAELAVFLSRAMKLDLSKVTIEKRFADDKHIPNWAKSAVYALADKKIINGHSNGHFGASNMISRAEAIVILNNYINKVDTLKENMLVKKDEKEVKEKQKVTQPVLLGGGGGGSSAPVDTTPKNQPEPSKKENAHKEDSQANNAQKQDKDAQNKHDDKKQVPQAEVAFLDALQTDFNPKMKEKLLEESSNQNIRQYKKDGKTITTFWVKGIVPPELSNDLTSEGNKLVYIKDASYEYMGAPQADNVNWYDVNKTKDGGNDIKLCSGATASNMFHWWLEQNDDYVKRYIELLDEREAKVKDKSFKPTGFDKRNGIIYHNGTELDRLSKHYHSFHGQDDSHTFKQITSYYPGMAVWANQMLDMLINGYRPKWNGEKNNENNYRKEYLDSKGGFFAEVFGKTLLTEVDYIAGNYSKFEELVTKHLKNGDALAVAFYFFGKQAKAHIETIWGADYDEEGRIIALYIVDSDDQTSTHDALNGKTVAMKRQNVFVTEDNEIRMTAHKVQDKYAVCLYDLYSLKDGHQEWQAFFAKLEEEKNKKSEATENHSTKMLVKPSVESELTSNGIESLPKEEKDVNEENIALSTENLSE